GGQRQRLVSARLGSRATADPDPLTRGVNCGRALHRSGTESSLDSPLEGTGFEISVPCYRRWSCRSPRYAIRAEQPSAGEITPPWAPIVCLPALNHALIVMGWHVEMHEV